jgi:hypothetical protein
MARTEFELRTCGDAWLRFSAAVRKNFNAKVAEGSAKFATGAVPGILKL